MLLLVIALLLHSGHNVWAKVIVIIDLIMVTKHANLS